MISDVLVTSIMIQQKPQTTPSGIKISLYGFPQGLAIGNGFIDPRSLQRYSHFVREVGLVDDGVADVMNHLETAVMQFIKDGEMLKAYAVST